MSDPEGIRIYPKHIRAAGMCMLPGAKTWFERYGLDWKDFIRNGVAIEDVIATGDELGMQVVRIARDGQ